MISSVFALKEAKTIPEYLISNKETVLEENYYTNSTYDFLLECHSELLSYRKDFYKTIIESGEENPYIINEAFSDVLSKIKEIIKKILAYIESIIKRFITQLAKFVKSDKHLSSKRHEISKFPKDEHFYVTGYNFTIKDNVPIVDIVGLDLSEIKDAMDTKGDVNAKLSAITQCINNLADSRRMDEIRGQILNIDYGIPETNFNNELFSVFRDGKSEESEIKIDKEYITKALKYFDGYSDSIKSLKRLQNTIKSKYKRLEDDVDKIISKDMTSDGSSKIANDVGSGRYGANAINDLKNSLDRLLTDQVVQIQRISNHHTQAIASKIDAYNALAVQDRGVLYKALSIVQKDINNTRTMRESGTSYDYTREASYREYVLEKYFMNQEQKRFVEECLALSESNIPELKVIQEDLKMDKKNMFEKIKQFVKEIFQKFLMKMNKLFVGDKKFLEKYKSIILTKKIEEYDLNDMPNYQAGIENIKSHKLQRLDLTKIVSKSESEIQQELLKPYNGSGDFVEFAKRYFLCDNKPNREVVKSSDLNMAEIYAFCTGAPAAVKVLESELKTFEQEADNIKNKVLQSLKESVSMIDIYGEKFYYSSVLESFINEEEENANGKAEGNAKLNLDVDRNDKAEKNKDLDKNVKSDDEGKDADTQAKEVKDNKDADAEKVKNAAKDYINTIKTITVTAKITAFNKIYSEYMKILRYHVQKATGSMGTTSKFSEDDVKNITNAMKEYKAADDKQDEEGRKTAAAKIISIYKANKMVIDNRDVASLVAKNTSKL